VSQLSAFDVELAVDEPAVVPLAFKDAIATDLHTVLGRMPNIGRSRKVAAYLYFRPDLLGKDERALCFGRSRVCLGADVGIRFTLTVPCGQVRVTGEPGAEIYGGFHLARDDGFAFVVTDENYGGLAAEIDANGEAWVDVMALRDDDRAETSPGRPLRFSQLPPAGVDATAIVGPRGIHRYLNGPTHVRGDSARTGVGWWVRINGERPRAGRQALKPCAQRDPEAPYMVVFRSPIADQPFYPQRDFVKTVTKAALAVGCRIQEQDRKTPSPIYADSLAQLLLALHWSPVLEHAVWWTVLGVELKSDDWLVAVDHACHLGRPWSEGLAKLSARPESDAIIRALRWLYEHKGTP